MMDDTTVLSVIKQERVGSEDALQVIERYIKDVKGVKVTINYNPREIPLIDHGYKCAREYFYRKFSVLFLETDRGPVIL